MRRDPGFSFYGWSVIFGLISFGMFLLWDFGFLYELISKDATYLSAVILVLFAAVSAYLGLAAWRLSREFRYTQHLSGTGIEATIETRGQDGREHIGWAHEHLTLTRMRRSDGASENESLTARLVERVHRGHASGWFLSDLLLRLGLIGTVIGFVLMLGAVYELGPGDVSELKDLMATLGSGMQVALYTTLCGLGSSILVSLQCKWLDRCADALISEIIKLGVEAE